jgi:hypothetical protein
VVDDLACGRAFTVSVVATDASGNRSAKSTLQTATAPCVAALRVSLAGSSVQGRPAARLVCRFRSTLRARGSGTLVVTGTRPAKKKVVLQPGVTTVAFGLPRAARNKRVRVVLNLADPQGGTRVYSWSFRIPK